jgi:hypothetical protein
VLLERVERPVDEIPDDRDPAQNPIVYHVRHLKRFPLGTESPEIIEFISQLMARRTLAGRTGLIVDATSFGMLIAQEMRRCGLRPVPITFTSGVRSRGNNVPKKNLLSRLLLLFQQGRLRIPPSIKLRAELIEEFDNFTVKYTKNGNPTFSAAAGAHDDLIMALALACHFLKVPEACPASMPLSLGRQAAESQTNWISSEFCRTGCSTVDLVRAAAAPVSVELHAEPASMRAIIASGSSQPCVRFRCAA